MASAIETYRPTEMPNEREPIDTLAIYRTDLVQLRIPKTSASEPPPEFIAHYPGLGSIILDSAKAQERFGLIDQEVLVAALSLAGASLTRFAADFGHHPEWLTASRQRLLKKLGAPRMTVAQETLLRSGVTQITPATAPNDQIGTSHVKILEALRFTGSVPEAIEYAGLRVNAGPQSGKHHYMELQGELLDRLGVRAPYHAIPVAYLRGVIHKWQADPLITDEMMEDIESIELRVPAGATVCAAAALRQQVDLELNGGAIAEAAEATDMLQEAGDEPQEYKVFTDGGRIVRFRPQDYGCAVCGDNVELTSLGHVSALGCKVSGDCEVLWTEQRPEYYLDDSGNLSVDALPCAAEACKAILGFATEDKEMTITLNGKCQLTEVGKDWMVRAGIAAATAKLASPDDGIPEFDGQPDPDNDETPSA